MGNALDDLSRTCGILFGDDAKKQISDFEKEVVDQLDEASSDPSIYDSVLESYQKKLFLPEKNFSDTTEYMAKYEKLQENLFAAFPDLALQYRRDSYNKKLREVLSGTVLFFTSAENPKLAFAFADKENKDVLINQYKDALQTEFDKLAEFADAEKESGKTATPILYAEYMIDQIGNMIDNTKFCVIVTGNDHDAYTLFEVLNDRSLEIEDLDLIKNLFYKWYCNHSGESDSEIDATIEDVDKIWVEKVFSPDASWRKDKAKLISFFAAEYFTADSSLKYNDKERYREKLESEYLANCTPYENTDVKNDIYIYEMLSIIIEKFNLQFSKKAEYALRAESDTMKSVTFKALNVLNALKQPGVMPAITNAIIKQFVVNNTDPVSGLIQIDKFGPYVDAIIADAGHTNPEYKYIHEISFAFWKYALLCSNAELPREEAKKVIAKVNKKKLETDYQITASDEKKMNQDFEDWISSWYYGKKSDTDPLKVKLLFIRLINTKKDNSRKTLSYSTVRSTFAIEKLQLDHMEPQNPNPGAMEKYFKPVNPGDKREAYINSLGNMMLTDSDTNNNKDNLPLPDALKYYDDMCKDHWLVREIRDMLKKHSKKVPVGSSTCLVPVESFFTERGSRLAKYFETILSSSLDDTEMKILK